MKHTPGPWKLGKTPDSIITDPTPETRPDLIGWYGGDVVAETVGPNDRHLISAAPDLLIACQKAYATLDAIMGFYGQNLQVYGWHLNGDPEPFDNFIDENTDGDEMELLYKAMAKARGEENQER